MLRATVLVLLACAAAAEEGPFEWCGIFETPKTRYMWVSQAAGGQYADPSMKMVAMPAAAATEAELATLKTSAEAKMEAVKATGGFGLCTDIEPGGTFRPSISECFNLKFYSNTLDSIYTIDVASPAIAFCTAHLPTEFEDTEHYFKLMDGTDIEPSFEKGPPEPEVSKPWGVSIGAAVIVNLVTLIGVLLLIPVVSAAVTRFPEAFECITNAFAAGALLAAAFFLLTYESTHLIAITETRTEAQASSAWGCMILLGFVSAFILDGIVGLFTGGNVAHTHDVPPVDTEAPKAQTTVVTSNGSALGSFPADGFSGSAPGSFSAFPSDGVYRPSPLGGGPLVMGNAFGADVQEIDADIAAGLASNARRKRIFCGILLGDFMHNFVDGVFIAAGFLNCGPTMGWSVTAASVYHEIGQEIADFVILTDPMQGGLSAPFALLVNFLSGTGVIFGVICVLAQDKMENYDNGMLLAFGGGIYVQIGAAEAMPRVYVAAKSMGLRLVSVIAFFIGAMAIGLVLIDHKHCEAGGHGHAH